MNGINDFINDSSIIIDLESFDWLPHQRVCEILGKGPHWAKGKIKDGKWTEGLQYVRDPDGQIWVSIKGVKSWLLKNFLPASDLMDQALKFDSHGKANAMSQSGRGSRRNSISVRQPVYELSSRPKRSTEH